MVFPNNLERECFKENLGKKNMIASAKTIIN